MHPTGTGKSFIGFKLCEDHPDSLVCWLSPSEYIFQTQLENLAAVSDGYVPETLVFYTYAKLMKMSEEALGEIKPAFIILDEFHRAGAEFWGEGVKNLMKCYPDVPILGLSATNIRYLDNQRDMAVELFDGNIASEMTLGEAIVRGILSAPKYVLSIFSYQKDLEKYQRRVRSAKSKAVRDEAERYLEELRRALEKADGLDEIFSKHITDRHGKYIVFCANYEHLCEMTTLAREWFSKVDSEPHIYTAYSDDPATSREFNAFKKDDSDHLKLLFCIDMLNEGIHVEDVCGVILLRPTVSPIIYKQQIGRALSASKKNNSVIFDIVLNIENLYSIGAIEEEMQIATTYYRFLGLDDEIVTEHFKVIDEVRDCIALFDKLNETLTASWDLMYEHAKRYFEENGDINIPGNYVSEGVWIARWLSEQVARLNGKPTGRTRSVKQLTEAQIGKLKSLGIRENVSRNDLAWEEQYAAAKAFFEKNGHLSIPQGYVSENGKNVRVWLVAQRRSRRDGKLSDTQIDRLNAIGIIWSYDNTWEIGYQHAAEYYAEHGDLNVLYNYSCSDGYNLGKWIHNQRSDYQGTSHHNTLTPEKVSQLERIGMVWNVLESRWQDAFEMLADYYRKNGHCKVKKGRLPGYNFDLLSWITAQRIKYRNGELSEEQIAKMESIHFDWLTSEERRFENYYAAALRYYKKNGNMNVPVTYVDSEGVALGRWVRKIQTNAASENASEMNRERVARLEALGVLR